MTMRERGGEKRERGRRWGVMSAENGDSEAEEESGRTEKERKTITY